MAFIKRVDILTCTLMLVTGLLLPPAVVYSTEGGRGYPESLIFTADLPEAHVAAVKWGRDPFISLVKGIDSPDMKLSAIFFNTLNPSAIINGNVVYKKSEVDGQKVIDIGKSRVILQGISGTTVLEIAGLPVFPKAEKQPLSRDFNKSKKGGSTK